MIDVEGLTDFAEFVAQTIRDREERSQPKVHERITYASKLAKGPVYQVFRFGDLDIMTRPIFYPYEGDEKEVVL